MTDLGRASNKSYLTTAFLSVNEDELLLVMVKWGTLSQEKYKLLFIEAARVLRRKEGRRY